MIKNFATMKNQPPGILLKCLMTQINDVVETWLSLFLDFADEHLPLKQHRVKR